MKGEYFPYLPNSRIEDNKRYKYMNDIMDKNPFAFHKKKYYFSNSGDNTNNNIYTQDFLTCNTNSYNNNNDILINSYTPRNQNLNGENVNQELLVFQKENDKNINLYNSFMKNKSSSIEAHAQNYLNFISQHRNLSPQNKNNINLNINNNNFYNYPLKRNKSVADMEKINLENQKNFVPGFIKVRTSDITNPFFYDGVAKEIMKRNKEIMEYNLRESERKYNNNKIRKISRISNDSLPYAPGQITNPDYYNLGDSVLNANPIVNNRYIGTNPFIQFNNSTINYGNKKYNKLKSEFII